MASMLPPGLSARMCRRRCLLRLLLLQQLPVLLLLLLCGGGIRPSLTLADMESTNTLSTNDAIGKNDVTSTTTNSNNNTIHNTNSNRNSSSSNSTSTLTTNTTNTPTCFADNDGISLTVDVLRYEIGGTILTNGTKRNFTIGLLNGGSTFFEPIQDGFKHRCERYGITCYVAAHNELYSTVQACPDFRVQTVRSWLGHGTVDAIALKPCGGNG